MLPFLYQNVGSAKTSNVTNNVKSNNMYLYVISCKCASYFRCEMVVQVERALPGHIVGSTTLIEECDRSPECPKCKFGNISIETIKFMTIIPHRQGAGGGGGGHEYKYQLTSMNIA